MFWILDALFNKYQLKEFFNGDMTKLKLSLHQMKHLIKLNIPDIFVILEEKEISCELFILQWFITIFSYDFDSPSLKTLWDLFLINGWKFIFQVSLEILKELREKIYNYESEKLLHCLKESIRGDQKLQQSIIKHALNIKVTNKQLLKLQQEFENTNLNESNVVEDNDKTIILRKCDMKLIKKESELNTTIKDKIEMLALDTKKINYPFFNHRNQNHAFSIKKNFSTQTSQVIEINKKENTKTNREIYDKTKIKCKDEYKNDIQASNKREFEKKTKYEKRKQMHTGMKLSLKNVHKVNDNYNSEASNNNGEMSARIPYCTIRMNNPKRFVFETISNKSRSPINSARETTKSDLKVTINEKFGYRKAVNSNK